MQSELIESVRALAEAQKPLCDPRLDSANENGYTYCRHCGVGIYIGKQRYCDVRPNVFPALIAALERAERLLERAQSVCIDALGSGYGLTPAIEEDMRRLNADIVAHRSFPTEHHAKRACERLAKRIIAATKGKNARNAK